MPKTVLSGTGFINNNTDEKNRRNFDIRLCLLFLLPENQPKIPVSTSQHSME